MSVYRGSCHCARVQFEIDIEPAGIIECNCSICTKKGIVHVPVQDSAFRLLAGEDALALYQFGSGAASHWFCRHCGIHTFGRPRADPSRHTVNARCLDDYETVFRHLPVTVFDGREHPLDRR